MSQNVTIAGTNYNSVPSVKIPKQTSGTATFYDVSDTTAAAANVQQGYYFYTSAGVKTQGTLRTGAAQVETTTKSNSSATATSLAISVIGQPVMFELRYTGQLTRSSNSSYYYVVNIRYNGTNTNGNYWRMSNGTFYNDTTHYSFTYARSTVGGTLTVKTSGSRTSAGGSFYNGTYELVYAF